jgi:hypothetical protein
VTVQHRIRPDRNTHVRMVLAAKALGFDDETIDKKKKTDVAAAAIRIVAYDTGLKKAPKGTCFAKWLKEFEDALAGKATGLGESLLQGEKHGRKDGSYWKSVESTHPGYLHNMFWLACKKVGYEAMYREIADAMNDMSDNPASDIPALDMSREKLVIWFREMKGKALKRVSRPILTPDRKADRVQWCKDRQAHINDISNPFYVAFLDEKWFYTRSNRKKAKYLPLGDNEELQERTNCHNSQL